MGFFSRFSVNFEIVKALEMAWPCLKSIVKSVNPLIVVSQVLEHDRRCINDDRVDIRVMNSAEPSPVSSWDKQAFGFQVRFT